MKSLVQHLAEKSAVGFGLGLAPKAPGTFGSLGGLLVGYLIRKAGDCMGSDSTVIYASTIVFLLIIVSAFAWWSIDRAEKAWGTHDEGKIVIDEIAGQAIAVAFLPISLPAYALGFCLFRILDIWKPGPIGAADENLPGAAGTLVDDLIAGIFAGMLAAAVFFLLAGSAP